MARALDGSRFPPYTPPYFLFGNNVAFIACAILCTRTSIGVTLNQVVWASVYGLPLHKTGFKVHYGSQPAAQ
eukprot:1147536-Pelagomonas_calceolata.AAC.6